MPTMFEEEVRRRMGGHIRVRRRAIGMDWRALGERIGRSKRSVVNMENGPTPATAAILCQIARVLDVHPAELLMHDDDRRRIVDAMQSGTLAAVLGVSPAALFADATPAAPPATPSALDATVPCREDIKAAIGARLRQMRTAAGLTKDAIAALLYRTPRWVERIETGRLVPKVGQICLIARATGHPACVALVFDAPGFDLRTLLLSLACEMPT